MRKFEKRTMQELEDFREETRKLVKAYYIAIYKNHDYCNSIDRIRMETVYQAAKQDLKDVMWEIEGRNLNILN